MGIWFTLKAINRVRTIKKWPTVDAVVSSYLSKEAWGGYSEDLGSWFQDRHFQAYLIVSYPIDEFAHSALTISSVDGYTTQVKIPERHAGHHAALTYAQKKYPEGSTIKLYYNPKNPTKTDSMPRVRLRLIAFPVIASWILLGWTKDGTCLLTGNVYGGAIAAALVLLNFIIFYIGYTRFKVVKLEQSVICSTCSTPNPIDVKFCEECGVPLCKQEQANDR